MGVVEDYFRLTEQYKTEYGEKTILLMQVGSFFEVYGLDKEDGTHIGSSIDDFSRINEMIIANKNSTYRQMKVVMAGFGLTVLEKNVKKLQENGYTIVVYAQDTPAKNTTRSLVEIISPGTYFGSDNQIVSNNTMCVWMHKSQATRITQEILTIGVSNVDVYTGRVTMSQFAVESFHNPCTYDEIERLVTVHRPSECLMVTNFDKEVADDIIQFVGLDQSKVHLTDISTGTQLSDEARNAEKQLYQFDIFKKFFPGNEETFACIIQNNYIAIQSLTLLLNFIYRHSPYLVSKLSFPEIQASSSRLTLANHSLKQLNILDDSRHTGKLRSVSAFLNNCSTTMGKRRFMHCLSNPITDVAQLSRTYDVTSYLLDDGRRWSEYRGILAGVSDLEKLVRKVVMKRATPKDIAVLGGDLRRAISIYDDVKTDPYLLLYFQKQDHQPINALSEVVLAELEGTFDLDACSIIDDMSPAGLMVNAASDRFIKEGRNEDIDSGRVHGINGKRKLESIKDFLCACLKEEKSRGGELVKIHETARQNPTLQLTQRRAMLLKSHIAKLPHHCEYATCQLPFEGFNHAKELFTFNLYDLTYLPVGNSKQQYCVSNAHIEDICRGLQTTKDKLVQHYIAFYSSFLERFQKLLPEIETITNFLTAVDMEQCRCFIAHKYNYCKPSIIPSDKAFFKAEGIRHPLIEHLQTQETYVTNNLCLGNSLDGLLLYGTNAVGKTSLIKSIGIAVIMAQAGLYVPCREFAYSPYTRIFTRILGADNIFKGLSTFAVEMSELRAILNQTDENSLILGDELCSGTESDSALSIFTAGLEELHVKRCTFLFATHFHEVCQYDEIKCLDRLVSMHMEVMYDRENGVLTYDRKLKKGPGDSMYGLEVCKSLNLSERFLERAHSIRTKYNAGTRATLSMSPSRYNAKKLKQGLCEICNKNPAQEMHHLAHQAEAREDNQYINSFHKNHPANLINICEECHRTLHESDSQHRRVKTSNGYVTTATQ